MFNHSNVSKPYKADYTSEFTIATSGQLQLYKTIDFMNRFELENRLNEYKRSLSELSELRVETLKCRKNKDTSQLSVSQLDKEFKHTQECILLLEIKLQSEPEKRELDEL